MQNIYFHDKKHISEKKVQKKIIPLKYIDQKRVVDINKLLNRVRLEKKSETKKNIFVYCSAVLVIGFFMTVLTIF
tara:strand:+ start:228 stop:452 length:225 start_codon:yes stop_codon:yes gene_type:complete